MNHLFQRLATIQPNLKRRFLNLITLLCIKNYDIIPCIIIFASFIGILITFGFCTHTHHAVVRQRSTGE